MVLTLTFYWGFDEGYTSIKFNEFYIENNEILLQFFNDSYIKYLQKFL